MKWLSLTLALLVLDAGLATRKCCKPEEVLKRVGASFECTKDSSRRLQVRANSTDFLYQNRSGQCLEVLEDEVVVLNVSDAGVRVQKEAVEGEFFPKCCPLGYVYDTVLHGCRKTRHSTASFFQEPFVKVGLANCRLVLDFVLNGTEDFRYKLLDPMERFKRNELYPGSYCIDKTEKGSLVVRECQESLRVCEGVKCIKKCCPDGQSFVDGARCFDTYQYGVNLTVFRDIVEEPNDPFAIIYNTTCRKIYRMTKKDFNFTVNKHGVFTEYTDSKSRTEDISDLESYCIEYSKKSHFEGYSMFHCFPEKNDIMTKFDYTFWPLIMSMVFLALTIFIYVILNETRKMFGKILVNYCIAMFFSFAALTFAQLEDEPTATECQIKAFSITFFAVSSFAWSNIMCWDIWCTFGKTKRYLGTKQKQMDLTKLLLYSLYGWGFPLLLTLVIFIFHRWKVLPYSIQPFLAEVKCFFDSRKGNFGKDLFYNIPLLIIQMMNMVLFAKTVVYCLKVKNEINRINDTTKDDKMKRYQGDRERLFLILKLLVIMGMSYIFEVISSFFDMTEMGGVPAFIELVWDTINALQGVFIFIIFICKKKIILGCLQKFNLIERSNASNSSSLHTQSSLNLNNISLSQFGSSNKGFK